MMDNTIYMLGLKKEKIDTPAFLIDLDIMEKNINLMSEYCKSANINLRPHTKHHKSPIIAHKQLQAGAIGICCQKLGEAEVMVAAGIPEILITYEIIGEIKIKRLMSLCNQSKIIVTVDSRENINDLSEAATSFGVELGILLDVNVGQNRCGIEPNSTLVESLSKQIISAPKLQFKGIHGYAGSIQSIANDEERKKADSLSMNKAEIALEQLKKLNIPVEIVTAGGTGTYNLTSKYEHVTEIQP